MQWLNEDQSEIDKLVDYTKAMFENLNKINSATKQTAEEV